MKRARAGAGIVMALLLAACGIGKPAPSPEPSGIGAQVKAMEQDTSLMREANAAASDVIRVAGDCDATRPLIPAADFRVRSFRSNLVLRWEWRPGSTLYVIWQQDRFGSEVRGDRIGPRDLLRSVGAPGDNFFAVKAAFWLPLG